MVKKKSTNSLSALRSACLLRLVNEKPCAFGESRLQEGGRVQNRIDGGAKAKKVLLTQEC